MRGAVVLAALLALVGGVAPAPFRAAEERGPLRVLLSEPASLDPARALDAGTVQVQLQLYAGLTRVDDAGQVVPSLAESWTTSPDGLIVTFRLRDGLRFSDGSPLTSDDVRRSWLRLLDPAIGSGGTVILDDVAGARDYAAGAGEAADVGVEAPDARTVVVSLRRPASHFPAAVATPATFVVPPAANDGEAWSEPPDFVASGPYVASRQRGELVLEANPNYVGGPPAIERIETVSELDEQEPAELFGAGELDLAQVAPWDAALLRYDAELGPYLHRTPSLAIRYFGFDASQPPFDDERVRRAFLLALDRARLVELGESGAAAPAPSVVPPALWPAGVDERLVSDPDEARALLREAGFASGGELGPLRIGFGAFDAPGAVATWEEELEVDLEAERMAFDDYYADLPDRPPHIYTISWIADYPSPHALYGVLLTPGAEVNYGRWRDSRFDDLLDAAVSADDGAEQAEAYAAVDAYLDEAAPVVPYAYDEDWWLVREGLAGVGSLAPGLTDFGRLEWVE